jgi:hypothetical protein
VDGAAVPVVEREVREGREEAHMVETDAASSPVTHRIASIALIRSWGREGMEKATKCTHAV